MRVVASEEELVRLYPTAVSEAHATFGSGEIYIEHMIPNARHVEIQIAADSAGATIHLGERDCSLQRRHQKMLEEAPSPGLDPALRNRIAEAAVKGAQAAGYSSLGTMEFLVDPNGDFFFIEMNCRIQVEHGVTEMITGLDLVKLQIRLAAGEPLPLTQQEVQFRGHAIEARVLSEDPRRDFAPEFAPIQSFRPPGGPFVRVDGHIFSGYQPPPFYDSLLAKIIAWGEDRDEALDRLERALRETELVGPKTTIPFLVSVLEDTNFRHGKVHTQDSARLVEAFAASQGEVWQ